MHPPPGKTLLFMPSGWSRPEHLRCGRIYKYVEPKLRLYWGICANFELFFFIWIYFEPTLALCWVHVGAILGLKGRSCGSVLPMLDLCWAHTRQLSRFHGLFNNGKTDKILGQHVPPMSHPKLKLHGYCKCFRWAHAHKNALAPSVRRDFTMGSFRGIEKQWVEGSIPIFSSQSGAVPISNS